jgi:hypothetical protein
MDPTTHIDVFDGPQESLDARGGHKRHRRARSERLGEVVLGSEGGVGAELRREASPGLRTLHDRHPCARGLERPHPDDPEGSSAHDDG